MASSPLHIVVLGGGSSGEHFVGALRRFDGESRVTLVERRLVGGECSYWACMPTKTMLRAPELLAATRHSFGAITGAELDPAGIWRWRDRVAEKDDTSQVEWLSSKGADLVRGDAVVTKPGVVQVGDLALAYDRLVIATGSTAFVPPLEGLAGTDYWTNIEATEASEAPGRLVVLGGGPVGCELAQFFSRIGSAVTLIEGGDRILARVDADAAAEVDRALRADGIDIRLGALAQRVDGRIKVNEQMRAAETVWAIGDVTGIAQFTHVGKYHARIAAADLCGRPARADHRAIPATIFTDPQVAMVGDTTGGVSSTWQLSSVARLATYERPKRGGFIKVVADPGRRILTGAVAVGPEAGEWLQQLTLAIRAEIPIDVLLDVIQPYPTFSEAVFLALRELNLDL